MIELQPAPKTVELTGKLLTEFSFLGSDLLRVASVYFLLRVSGYFCGSAIGRSER